jgi:hypothetical protein
MESRMESGDRLYRARAYAIFSGGIGATDRTRREEVSFIGKLTL